MTTVQFLKNKSGWLGYYCFGHSGYAKAGNDIICASISTAVQMTATGITAIKKIKAEVVVVEERAQFSLVLNEPVKEAQDMIEMLYVTIQDLVKQYPKYVKLEVIEKC